MKKVMRVGFIVDIESMYFSWIVNFEWVNMYEYRRDCIFEAGRMVGDL